MAIRYDPGYNAEIRRIVRNFNRKRNRAYARGFRNLPDIIRVSDLKARYESRKDLNRELRMLQKFSSNRNALEVIEKQGGASAIEWEFSYLKQNLKGAIDFFTKRYMQLAGRVGRFPGERLQLDNIADKISILNMNINYMNQEQFRSYKATIDEFLQSASKRRAGYKGFMNEVTNVMRLVGYNEKTIRAVINKVSELTPDQFYEMYNTSDLIGRVFDLADSPTYGGMKLNTSEENAKEILDALTEEVDDLVNRAKQPKEEYEPLNEFMKAISKEKTPRSQTRKKIPKSKLSKKDLEMLNALGGIEGIVDESK